MEKVKENVSALMARLDYPAEAQQVFLDALDLIAADKVAYAWFGRLMAQHDQSENCDYKQMLEDIKALGSVLGLHEHTSGMLLFLCLGEKLRERYIERGIDEEIFYASMADLRYKLEECRLVYGTVGTFVASWYAGFFKLTRFAFTRLQFEVITFSKEYKAGDTVIPAGSKALNMHIPRTGTKLDHDEVLKSYREAAEFFADQFEGRPILFTCCSWLLDTFHEKVLSPNSNMMAFYHDFSIVETGTYQDYGPIWRLFDRRYNDNIDEMPADTALRRAYIDRVKRGEPVGWSRGIFRWEDGKVVRP